MLRGWRARDALKDAAAAAYCHSPRSGLSGTTLLRWGDSLGGLPVATRAFFADRTSQGQQRVFGWSPRSCRRHATHVQPAQLADASQAAAAPRLPARPGGSCYALDVKHMKQVLQCLPFTPVLCLCRSATHRHVMSIKGMARAAASATSTHIKG